MHSTNNKKPLLVDLDGSLLASDTLQECLVLFIKQHPFRLYLLFWWLLQGKVVLKRNLAQNVSLNITVLPYRHEVVDYLKAEYASGRRVILCTGCWHGIAEQIAAFLGCFHQVVATDSTVNLTGTHKAQWAVGEFGQGGFDYMGNEAKDLKVWGMAHRALIVGSGSLAKAASLVATVEHHFEVKSISLKQWFKAIRIHQWAKNALVFVPIFTSHKFADVALLSQVVIGFVSFGLCASATYLLNDLFDLESDRKHPTKCNRPLAAGVLGIATGIVSSALMLIAAIALAMLVNVYFLITLLCYLAITVLYSFKLKSLSTVDVITLASLFTVRVIAGGAAIGVMLSFWLLSFSMFIFLSLAMVKRVAELVRVESEGSSTEKISGRGYFTADTMVLQSLGSSAGFLAVLVFALYINSQDVIRLYRHPEILWLMCPVLGYWIMRVWMLAARNQMNEDPISFAIKDPNSWAVALIMAVILTVATLV